MPEKIKVNLFTNYAGDAQYSMLSYAAQIEKGLRLYSMDSCRTTVFTPAETGFGKIIRRNPVGRKLDSYWNRFVKHPIIAWKISDGINHITDHNNSYLIRYLDPGRTVVTCHDLIHFRISAAKRNNRFLFPQDAIRRYTASGLRAAAKIIADSENTKKDIIELLGVPSGGITVIYPGMRPCFRKISDADIIGKGKKRLNFNWDKSILHVGENSYYKNISAILHALKILRETGGKEIHFVKVGSDFTSQQQALIRKLKIRDYVHYLGNLDDDDLNLAYNLSDVLVFPSLYEGFGWPPLEAMACGTPVVASDKGSLKEVLGDAAVIAEPDDYEKIAGAVLALISDPGMRSEKIRQGYDNVKRFDWKKAALEILRVYRAIERCDNG